MNEQEIDTAVKRLAAHHASVGWPTDQVILGLARDITSLADALDRARAELAVERERKVSEYHRCEKVIAKVRALLRPWPCLREAASGCTCMVCAIRAVLADPQPATERCGWDHADPADPCPECEPAPAATGNPAAYDDDENAPECPDDHCGWHYVCAKCRTWVTEPAVGKAATGERHEYERMPLTWARIWDPANPEPCVYSPDFASPRCGQPADAAVHQATTEDNK